MVAAPVGVALTVDGENKSTITWVTLHSELIHGLKWFNRVGFLYFWTKWCKNGKIFIIKTVYCHHTITQLFQSTLLLLLYQVKLYKAYWYSRLHNSFKTFWFKFNLWGFRRHGIALLYGNSTHILWCYTCTVQYILYCIDRCEWGTWKAKYVKLIDLHAEIR